MYKHMLIPTDGSELSKKAAQHGIALAKAVKAKITAVTVSAPFQTLVVEPYTVMDLLDQYREIVLSRTAKYLDAVRDIAATMDVACDVMHVEHEHPYQAIIDTARKRGCRFDRHGFPWPAWRLRHPARQRDGQGAGALRRSRPRLSLRTGSTSNTCYLPDLLALPQ